MQRRDEHDLVTILELVRALAFQLPIRIVDEDENTWSTFLASFSLLCFARGWNVHGIALHKEFGTFGEDVRA